MSYREESAERIPQEEYDQLVEPYREAMTRLEVRMNGLNEDYRKKYRDYPRKMYKFHKIFKSLFFFL